MLRLGFTARTREHYVDGGIYNNNPCELANDERKLLCPSEAGMHPDISLSLGTGHHGEASGPFDVTSPRETLLRLHTMAAH